MNGESVAWFAEYAEKVTELFSDRVKYFITFNEPQCFIGQGYYQGLHAPGLKVSRKDILQMAHNVMKAHGAAVIAMRKAAKQPIKIGYAPTCSAHYPATDTPADMDAARKLFFACQKPDSEELMWCVSWWSDPVILGHYPADGLEMYKDYLPEITDEDMALIHQPIDFYGQNIYNGKAVSGANGVPTFVPRQIGAPRTAIGWPITPEALQWGPRFLYERYGLPIYITENGMSAHDVVSLDGRVHDPNRIDFTHRYLLELEKAADAGVPVEGYFHWSFMDNFEWGYGYTERFGMVYVDYETQQRIPKDSALWYRDWIKQNT
jgi:beta-glucosidase